MKSYFLNIPNEERQNILDQHKKVYDGYVTNHINSSEQPLYVQDLANDKGGITVNNKGEVKTYTNVGINESEGLPFDMIGDGDDDLEHGTVGDEHEELCSHCGGRGYDEFTGDQCDWCGGSYDLYEDDDSLEEEDDKSDFDIDVEFTDELDEDDSEMVKESVKESLDWFKRFTKYN
jgi:hypothetical protein